MYFIYTQEKYKYEMKRDERGEYIHIEYIEYIELHILHIVLQCNIL